MAEYIEREAFKKSVEERYCKPCKAEGKDHNGCWCRACWVDDMLDEVECFQTSDVAPVVRCKDCQHRGTIYCPAVHETMGNWLVDYTSDEAYCWRGRPKVYDNAT